MISQFLAALLVSTALCAHTPPDPIPGPGTELVVHSRTGRPLPLPVETEAGKLGCATLLVLAQNGAAPRVLTAEEIQRFESVYFGEHGLLTMPAVLFAMRLVGEQYGAFTEAPLTRQPEEAAREVAEWIIDLFDEFGVSENSSTSSGYTISRLRRQKLEQKGRHPNEFARALKKAGAEAALNDHAREEGEKLGTLLRESPKFREGFEKLMMVGIPLILSQSGALKIMMEEAGKGAVTKKPDASVSSELPQLFDVGEAFGGAVAGYAVSWVLGFAGLDGWGTVFASTGAVYYGFVGPWYKWARLQVAARKDRNQLKPISQEILVIENNRLRELEEARLRVYESLAVHPGLVPDRIASGPVRVQSTPTVPATATVLLEAPAAVDSFDWSKPAHMAAIDDLRPVELLSRVSESLDLFKVAETCLSRVQALNEALHEFNVPLVALRERLRGGGADSAAKSLAALVQRLETPLQRITVRRSEILAILVEIRREIGVEQQIASVFAEGLKKDHAALDYIATRSEDALARTSSLVIDFEGNKEHSLELISRFNEADKMLKATRATLMTSRNSLEGARESISRRVAAFDELQHRLVSDEDSEEALDDAEIQALKNMLEEFQKKIRKTGNAD